ncbi:MAG: enoyl-CoA hydratase/isomerase family protein [Candidatus Lokiarchaeota archaeon]|nr:enoyl-CoA hydratase/isomerase family protein [Candidatus Lokiarchaeota archaeon]
MVILFMEEKFKKFGEYIEFSVNRHFGIITLNRIHRSNSFTIDQLKHLKKAIEFCQNNEKIKGIILTANGNSFSTGMDLGEITKYDYKDVKELEHLAASICQLLFNGKPAICAINGRTLGEGVVFLVCCDYRLAVKDSFFQMPEINSAIFPGTGCVTLFSKIIGIPWTKKMLMFSERLDANKALEIGLIDEIVENQEELMKTALNKAKFINSKNSTVMNAIKILSNHLMDKNFAVAYPLETIASDWYKFTDKKKILKDFQKSLNWID